MAEKVLVSDCEKAWFFNSETRGRFLEAGMACFLPGCQVEIMCKGKKVAVPGKVVTSSMPTRILNARLPLL